jgi:APA family basic amino acid/polyamine antiporter
MARDGLIPKVFASVHPKFRTPYVTTITTGIVAAFFAGLFPIGVLGELVSIGTLLAFAIVSVGVLVLRYTNPELPRPFKTPLVPIVPILGALVSLLQMFSLPSNTWIRLIVWMVLGLIIYFFYGTRHSLVKRK